ncbi:MAG: hypothetical protein GXY18_13590 [Methanomicrobiales archaeon]|nr:hypothetical protein [Methanomicrobiales archaeon]
MRRTVVEVEIQFFDVFTMIAFFSIESVQTLLEDGVFSVPERWTEADPASGIRQTADTIFTPSIHPASRMIVGKIAPRRSIMAVILTNRTPLSFA